MIMMGSKRRVNMEEYYHDLNSMPLPVFSKNLEQKTKCRVCLQGGDMPITSLRNPRDINEALIIFCNVDAQENGTYLCYVCYKFLKSAFLFRKVAQRNNKALSQPILKENSLDCMMQDNLNDFEDNLDNKSNSIQSNKSNEKDGVKCKKKRPKVKSSKAQCPICKKVLLKNHYFKIHIQLHNPNLPDQFICDICGKSFKLRKVYAGHMERHETRYIFKCEQCPYAARYKANLSMHMRIHSGDMKYLCTQCPARYITRGRLNAHISLKHTEPQYECHYCPKAYHHKLQLQTHIDASHLGIKNHACHLCGKTFGYRKKLLEHLRNFHMTKIRPFGRFYKKPNSNNSDEM